MSWTDKQKSDLRLDRRQDASRGGKSGKPIFVPGKSAESEIIARVTSSDPDERMPSKGEPLTAEQITQLRAWIDQGAVCRTRKNIGVHQTRAASSAAVKNKLWPETRLITSSSRVWSRKKLSPSPEADRATLIRRVSLDLTACCPRSKKVDAFSTTGSSEAYGKVVDRLLASPHYGEHLARGWLDLRVMPIPTATRLSGAFDVAYREWVINAFNRNMPFDQFTIEQLAGDLLPKRHAGAEDRHRFQPQHQDQRRGGGDDEEYRTKAVKDRVATTQRRGLV